jgi:uncharacterized RDD family membrane protein YckC
VTGLDPAPWLRRGAAALVDAGIGLLAFALCAMWLVIGVWALRALPRDWLGGLVLYLAVYALGAGLHMAYHVSFLGGCGQTPGRMLLGIGVVRRDGARAGYGRAALRSLGALISLLTLGLAGLVVLMRRQWRRERCAVADVISGTRVVRWPAPRP